MRDDIMGIEGKKLRAAFEIFEMQRKINLLQKVLVFCGLPQNENVKIISKKNEKTFSQTTMLA